MRGLLALTLLGAVAAACLSPSVPPPVRYFEPQVVLADAAASESPPSLRIVAVTAARSVGEPMTWRLSELELAFDDLHRWVEPPAILVERALRQGLFEAGVAVESLATDSTDHRWEVEVVQFENDRSGQRAVVTLELRDLRSDGAVWTRRIRTEAQAGGRVDSYAKAMGAALSASVEQVRAWLVSLPQTGG